MPNGNSLGLEKERIKLYKFNNNKEILEKSKKIIAKQQFLCYNRIGLFETTEK